MEYREFLSLSDEEIKYIITDIFKHTSKVDNITRNEKWNSMTCNIYIMKEYPHISDTLDLEIPTFYSCGITTHDFVLTGEEILKWQQWLLAKGCDLRLKNNPYFDS